MASSPPESATLDDLPGRGYGVVESLASLGKGRRCTGIFVTAADAAQRLDDARRERRRLRFEGPVHARHVSRWAGLDVEVTRVDPGEDGVTVEFTAHDVPYDLGGG